jgi:hypothetical protein
MNKIEEKKEIASAIHTKVDELNVLLDKADALRLLVFFEDKGTSSMLQYVIRDEKRTAHPQLKAHIREINNF